MKDGESMFGYAPCFSYLQLKTCGHFELKHHLEDWRTLAIITRTRYREQRQVDLMAECIECKIRKGILNETNRWIITPKGRWVLCAKCKQHSKTPYRINKRQAWAGQCAACWNREGQSWNTVKAGLKEVEASVKDYLKWMDEMDEDFIRRRATPQPSRPPTIPFVPEWSYAVFNNYKQECEDVEDDNGCAANNDFNKCRGFIEPGSSGIWSFVELLGLIDTDFTVQSFQLSRVRKHISARKLASKSYHGR